MAVLMEVLRVGVEAEVVMMIADTHDAIGIARTKLDVEMEIFTEALVALAHVQEVPIDFIAPVETAVTVTI